ncbi:stage V sporulation protein AD [Alicyclobacillus cycloheptanicus]|uniref:Stage V sporulation protein AD n=1 Tax=Alicyclobacillus cycloheptanicus TaxID=1457 RepID=A0ABT9XDR1_9BACL|nr:stage V sporulation protein AD [Alicyclobacillus cycloheptanicus]MDQ0188438.1 stage V sporulation protein AD [Alicyclobacillus cycloheptanicus]WDM01138.1 stage V sporulation protein AD [Alicyclobacillus cycloheptanicus]
MPKVGKQTWVFTNPPVIQATGTVAGKTESDGPFGDEFDIRHTDDRLGKNTWEHAEQTMFNEAIHEALRKGGKQPTDIDLMIGGDLNAQLTSFYVGNRDFPIPALGVYAACASITEALSVASLAIDGGYADYVLAGTSSHNSTAERQFRFPTEYGAQRPPTAQRTVTGSGVALLGRTGTGVQVSAATIGHICDYGIKSPWEMGAAMAPAAKSTIVAHLRDTGRTLADFDCVATGDLGRVGLAILHDLLKQDNFDPSHVTDCGALIFRPDQPEVFSGGSGGACCSLVTFAHFLRKLTEGTWQRILVSATGALLSNVSAQQGDTIPCVSHAVVLERKG